jgi:hypothetical protein
MLTWFIRRKITDLLVATVGAGLSAPALAHASVPSIAANVYTFGPGRIAAIVAVMVGLIGAVVGGLAIARSANGRRRAIAALMLSPIGMAIGGLVVATAGGGLGTGHGFGGGIVALVVGLIGIALGALGLARSRHAS